MGSSEYRLAARNALRGRWMVSVVVTFVAVLLGADFGMGNSMVSSSSSSAGSRMGSENIAGFFPSAWNAFLLWFLAGVALVMGAYVVIKFFFGGAATLGLNLYNIEMLQGRPQSPFSTLFSRFNIFGRALFLNLAKAFFVFLWSLLFIIPGIVAAYRYSMASYIMAQNPNIGALEAISQSKKMMRGHKMNLFFLHLSFIGWAFLCVFTFGIGFLWLNPYIAASEAAFYLHLTNGLPTGRATGGTIYDGM